MKNVFISYKHDDNNYVNDVRSVRINPNSDLNFNDRSLEAAVVNEYGDINRRPPHDPQAEKVKATIRPLLTSSSKLIVLIGNNTHSSGWVKWEMETFANCKGKHNILMMRVPGSHGGAPSGYSSHDIQDWNTQYLTDWINS